MSDRKWHQNPWTWCGCSCCLGLIVIPILLAFLGVGGAFWTLRNLGVHDQALERAVQNAEVVNRLGEPLEAGWLMNGNVSLDNGGGTADYSIPVHGPLGDGRLIIEARRSDGEWIFEELFVEVDGERIDILGSGGTSAIEAPPLGGSGTAEPATEGTEASATSSAADGAAEPN